MPKQDPPPFSIKKPRASVTGFVFVCSGKKAKEFKLEPQKCKLDALKYESNNENNNKVAEGGDPSCALRAKPDQTTVLRCTVYPFSVYTDIQPVRPICMSALPT